MKGAFIIIDTRGFYKSFYKFSVVMYRAYEHTPIRGRESAIIKALTNVTRALDETVRLQY